MKIRNPFTWLKRRRKIAKQAAYDKLFNDGYAWARMEIMGGATEFEIAGYAEGAVSLGNDTAFDAGILAALRDVPNDNVVFLNKDQTNVS